DLTTVLKSADAVAAGTGQPDQTRDVYEQAALAIAEQSAQPGESVEKAFSRLATQRDERIVKLYAAAIASDDAQRTARADLTKRAQVRGQIHDAMCALALSKRLAHETQERAYARLLSTNPEMMALHQRYTEA